MNFYKHSLLKYLITLLLFILSPTIFGDQEIYFLSKDGYALLKRAVENNKPPEQIKKFLFRLPARTFSRITPENSQNFLGITWQDSMGPQLITAPPPLLIIDLPGVGPTLFNAWSRIGSRTPIIEYTGEIITDPTNFNHGPYIMDAEPLNANGTRSHIFRKLDASEIGNASRFARHLPNNETLSNYNIVNMSRDSVATANIIPVQDPSLQGRIFIGSLDNPIEAFAVMGYDFGQNEQTEAPILFNNSPPYEPIPEESYWVENRRLCVINEEHQKTRPNKMDGASVAIDGLTLFKILAANTFGNYTLLPSSNRQVVYRVTTGELIRLIVNEQRMTNIYIAGTEVSPSALLEDAVLQNNRPRQISRNLIVVDIESTRRGEKKTISFPITIDVVRQLENNIEGGFRVLRNNDGAIHCLIPYPFTFMPTNIIDPNNEDQNLYIPGMVTSVDARPMLYPETYDDPEPIDREGALTALHRYLMRISSTSK